MTRKKKASRKPVEMLEPCYSQRGYLLAWCRFGPTGERNVGLWYGTVGRSDLRRLADWLPLAAEWVEGKKR